jgi:hypothetical protein
VSLLSPFSSPPDGYQQGEKEGVIVRSSSYSWISRSEARSRPSRPGTHRGAAADPDGHAMPGVQQL